MGRQARSMHTLSRLSHDDIVMNTHVEVVDFARKEIENVVLRMIDIVMQLIEVIGSMLAWCIRWIVNLGVSIPFSDSYESEMGNIPGIPVTRRPDPTKNK